MKENTRFRKEVTRGSRAEVLGTLQKAIEYGIRCFGFWFWARRFLKQWCAKAMHSKISSIKKIAGMLRRHHALTVYDFTSVV